MTSEQSVLAAGAASFVFSLLLTPLVRAASRRRGFVDDPGPRKIHSAPVALGGGIAIFGAVWLPLAAALLAVKLAPDALANALPSLKEHIPGARSVFPQGAAYLGGSLVLFVLGLVDDAKGLGPRVKLLTQIVVSVGVAASGIRLSTFLDVHPGGAVVQILVTVAWFVVVTNSLNLLDNMDGLAAGVAATAAAAFGIIALLTGQLFIALALFTLLGGALGFLAFNRPPASIFMGDAGSLTLGWHLAVLTTLFTFYEQGRSLAIYFVPLLILAVPLYDTASVILIRLRLKKPLMVGDTNHFSHRLVALGLSRRAAVGLIVLLTAITGASAILLYSVEPKWSPLVFLQTAAVLALVATLEVAGRRR
jgi:UDP-GlcNAc:undecaprenyl-phosphate GlcNAc-1-phosphate transferase